VERPLIPFDWLLSQRPPSEGILKRWLVEDLYRENRVQSVAKRLLPTSGLTWHFIGHIQTNKAKKIAESFDWIHS
jgi:hypothetical protein